MGWGHLGLSWTRYAKSTPTRNCRRCHLDYPEAADSCPHCRHIGDYELESFLHGLEEKRKKHTKVVIAVIASLLLYAIIILFVLPMYVH